MEPATHKSMRERERERDKRRKKLLLKQYLKKKKGIGCIDAIGQTKHLKIYMTRSKYTQITIVSVHLSLEVK